MMNDPFCKVLGVFVVAEIRSCCPVRKHSRHSSEGFFIGIIQHASRRREVCIGSVTVSRIDKREEFILFINIGSHTYHLFEANIGFDHICEIGIEFSYWAGVCNFNTCYDFVCQSLDNLLLPECTWKVWGCMPGSCVFERCCSIQRLRTCLYAERDITVIFSRICRIYNRSRHIYVYSAETINKRYKTIKIHKHIIWNRYSCNLCYFLTKYCWCAIKIFAVWGIGSPEESIELACTSASVIYIQISGHWQKGNSSYLGIIRSEHHCICKQTSGMVCSPVSRNQYIYISKIICFHRLTYLSADCLDCTYRDIRNSVFAGRIERSCICYYRSYTYHNHQRPEDGFPWQHIFHWGSCRHFIYFLGWKWHIYLQKRQK